MIEYLGIVIAAGGNSSRFGKKNKLLEEFNGIPLFIHSINNFIAMCKSENIVIAVSDSEKTAFGEIIKEYLPLAKIKIITGGKVRSESVVNALNVFSSAVRLVAVHDAARPLADGKLLEKCLSSVEAHGSGAIPAKPVTDTLKRVDAEGLIMNTVDRCNLWSVETPQVFELTKLREAYATAAKSNLEFTDDAAVMEYAGFPIHIVHNTAENIKVTYPEDLAYLQKIYG